MFLIPKIVFFISREQDQFSIFASIVYKQKFTRIKAQKESRSVEKLLIVNPPPSITRRKGSSKCSLTRCWNKSSLIFSKSCPRVSTVAVHKKCNFSKSPKSGAKYFDCLCNKICPNNFQNRPIWSHCPNDSNFCSNIFCPFYSVCDQNVPYCQRTNI